MPYLLTGGSTFGLNATDGVLKYLEEKSIGLRTRERYGNTHRYPSAVIYDLGIGNGNIRPDKDMGYEACINATDKSY